MSDRIDKVLQVWIDDPDRPSEKILGYMKGVIDAAAKNGCEYNLISTTNYFGDDPRVVWTDVKSAIEKALLRTGSFSKKFESFTVHTKSDIVRFYWATQNSKCMYADCDIEIVNFPNITSALPIFYKFRDTGLADYCAFAVNDQSKFFCVWFKFITEFLRTYVKTIEYGTVFKYLNHYKIGKDVGFFDQKDMIHHNI